MGISDELDLLASDVQAQLADETVSIVMRTVAASSTTMKPTLTGTRTFQVAVVGFERRPYGGDIGAGPSGMPDGTGILEAAKMTVTAAAIAAATQTTSGTPAARTDPRTGDVVNVGAGAATVAWHVAGVAARLGGRMYELTLHRKKSG